MLSWVKRGSKLLESVTYRRKKINKQLQSKQFSSFFQEGDSLVLGINYLERILKCACSQISESSIYFQCNYLHPDPAVTCTETCSCQQGIMLIKVVPFAVRSLLNLFTNSSICFVFTLKTLRNQTSRNQMQFLESISKLFCISATQLLYCCSLQI